MAALVGLKLVTPDEVTGMAFDPVDPVARTQAASILQEVREKGVDGLIDVAVRLKDIETRESKLVYDRADLERAFFELPEEERLIFLTDLGIAEPGLASLAREAYHLLGLQTYFTAGPKEIRAWTIERGWKAPQAAGVIHTDFERGFIRAEVYTVTDLLALKSEAALKSAGKMRVEGKEYIVQDGDVMHFRFNV
jgi:ribosome-binding ATPase YchF (GTP1/OBG family)